MTLNGGQVDTSEFLVAGEQQRLSWKANSQQIPPLCSSLS
jgi:hypothetical protein